MRRDDALPDILRRIVGAKREELRAEQQKTPLAVLRQRVARLPAEDGRSFSKAIRRGAPASPVRVIAEVKMASPSAGRLMDDETRLRLPPLYAEAGAAAISVLTEGPHFQGSLRHLTEARDALSARFGAARPPLLRKDFIFEPYQVWESKAHGADAILLIVALLPTDELAKLLSLSRELGMECLVEAHDEREVATALAAWAQIIGINNRDLHSFEVDLATTERLRLLIPQDRLVVAESGIRTRHDVECMAASGVDAVLVGEALVTAGNPAGKLRELLL
jgi:indole-3-glycerol phosphate synthase